MTADDKSDPSSRHQPPEPVVHILHRGDRYAVRFLRCTEERFAVVCFEYWQPQPNLDRPFSAEGFFSHRKTNAVGILAAENDWFQNAEIESVLHAINTALAGYTLIGYGSSMGGYGVINFADRLGLQRVITVCPQYSIDPARAPYETRWPTEAARIAQDGGFRQDRIDQVRPPVTGWLIHDPASVDAEHAARIQRHHRLTNVPVRFAQHHEMRMLQQAEMFTPLLLDMIDGRFNPVDFARRLRIARRRSAVFWIGLSAALLRHRRPDAARHAINQARALPHPEPPEIDLQDARVQAALSHHAAALRLVTPWIDDPAWGWAARALAADLHAALTAPVPPPPTAQPRWRQWLQSARHKLS